MIDFDELPIDLDEYEDFDESLEFPFLDPNSIEGCPKTMEEIEWYAKAEGGITKENLRFVRTANVNGLEFWLWEDAGAIDEKIYLGLAALGETTLLGLNFCKKWLTPEKYLAFRYADEWDWFTKPQ
jgi:hypothetical protein